MKIETVKLILVVVVLIYLVTFLERFIGVYTNHVDKVDYKQNKDNFEIKINNYEKGIFEDSVVIYNSDRAYRDSLRATINPR